MITRGVRVTLPPESVDRQTASFSLLRDDFEKMLSIAPLFNVAGEAFTSGNRQLLSYPKRRP